MKTFSPQADLVDIMCYAVASLSIAFAVGGAVAVVAIAE